MKERKIKLLGLMLTYNNYEVLGPWLQCYASSFEKIFNLDGSHYYAGEVEDALKKYKAETYKEQDFKIESKKDHTLRKILYDKIKDYVKSRPRDIEYWIVLCHPDEFYTQRLIDFAQRASDAGCNLIKAHNMHVFPMKKEIDEWKKHRSFKVFKHFLYPGHIENRIFKFTPSLNYIEGKHQSVIPEGEDYKVYEHKMKVLHYKIFNLEEHHKLEAGWSNLKSHYPNQHKFDSIESFFLEAPAGKYRKNKVMLKDNLLKKDCILNLEYYTNVLEAIK